MFVGALFLVGVAALIAVGFGAFEGSGAAARASYPVLRVQLSAAAARPPIVPTVARPPAARRHAPARRLRDATPVRRRRRGRRRPGSPSPQARIASTPRTSHADDSPAGHSTARGPVQSKSSPWIEAFYPICAAAQNTFSVDWC